MSGAMNADAMALEIEQAVMNDPCWFCEPGDDHHTSKHIGAWEASMIAFRVASHYIMHERLAVGHPQP